MNRVRDVILNKIDKINNLYNLVSKCEDSGYNINFISRFIIFSELNTLFVI